MSRDKIERNFFKKKKKWNKMLMKKIERKKIEEEKEKKTIIKRISIISDIYKKQNQMETDETKKN